MTWYPWFSLFMIMFTAGICLAMPRLSRPDIFFGVTVGPSFRKSEAGESIARRYKLHMACYAAAAIVLTFVSVFVERPGLSSAGIGVVAVGSLLALGSANRRARPHAAPPNLMREASLSVREDRLPGGWALAVLPFLILAASGVYLRAHWDEIPARFPIHFGFDGQPNGWATKTPGSVYGMLGLGALICLTMAVMSYSILKSRRISYRGKAAEYETNFRSVNVWTLLATEYFMAILFASIPLVSIFHPGTTPFTVLLNVTFTVILLVVLIAVYVRYGQGGTKLAGTAAVTDPPVGDRTPDQCWKWGIFYYNREDPAVMVEKRFGLGYTMNFGNIWSWVILGAVILLPAVSLLIVRQ